MPVDIKLFYQLPLFQGLSPAFLDQLSQQSNTKRYSALHTLLTHHSIPAFLVMVIRGQLQKTEASEDGRITGIGFTNPGEVLDWLSVVDGAPIIYSVTTTQETDLLLIPIGLARQLLKECPEIATHVLQRLASDVRRNTEQRQLLTLPNAFQRIFVQIVQLAEQTPDNKITNLPKQHEIAAMVNTSRETVSRAIQMLVKQGVLVKQGHRFVIQQSEQLKQLAATGTGLQNNPHKTEGH